MNTKVLNIHFTGIIISALILPFFAFAQGGDVSTSKKVDATCMATAVHTREEALVKAWETMSADTLEALETRREALKSAWEQSTSSRNEAIKDAWSAWKDDKKEIMAEFRSDRKEAWATFKSTAKKTCRTALPKEEKEEKAASDSIAI